ncbi:hypothetical protein [Streptomyces sp. NPDC101149]|uniref:hypothetical protein n=1 Tax=Streptomyces sp. NPDC101149 TaxID=3366113 RepID=UPI00382379D1
MKKLKRCIATTGTTAALVAAALTAVGGPATAATPAGYTLTRTTAVHTSHPLSHHRVEPWIADQLAIVDPTAAHRPATASPWVADQLATLPPTTP